MRRISLFVAVITMALFASVSFGQITSGDLVGTVKDPSGAFVSNANVTITNEDTHVAVSVKSGADGEFRAGNLLPGKYDVAVSSSGFQSYTLHGVTVDINKTATIPVTLSVGANTTVEVSAEAGVVLDTTSTNLTTTFSTEELASLPTATVGLGVINTSLLSPGVASTGGIGIGVGPSIGGQRPRNNNFTIEGIDNNNKAVTGPLVYVPNDSVGNFTLITNQFSPEFGHSSGGQFNTDVISGTNRFHGTLYEYFQNRNLNAASGIAGGKVPNPRYDNNRYGGQVGGPIFKDKLFFFGNFERNTIGTAASYYLCTPTAAGLSQLNSLAASYGFSANNLQQYAKYVPAANAFGGAQVTSANDNACFNSKGPQSFTVTGAPGSTNIPLGNYLVNTPTFSNFDALTTSMDYTLGPKDNIRGRYIYNTQGSEDTAANLPTFFTTQPFRFHLIALSEYHTFTPNLTNEFRLGYNRYSNTLTSGNFSYPGLDSFPNLQFYDQGFLSVGPDGNAPQFTIQNLYQVTDNIGWVKGKHSLKFGFDGRKYISPQGFTQRARGDYQWSNSDDFFHDLAPDVNGFGQRSTGNHTYYGDQTALYFYGNDTWRMTPTITINAGLRWEFTSVPVGERAQQLNSAASFPGLVNFHAPQPTYTSFAPRFGINWAPDSKTSIRAGFGIAYDVLFDNLGTLSFPPQYSSTNNVNDPGQAAYSSPNFLKNGGLPAGTGSGTVTFPNTPAGLALQRKSTSALLPDQVLPYAETYTLTIQRTIGSAYTAEIGYVGTRGIHLATQDQINVQPKATTTNQLGTVVNGSTTLVGAGSGATTLAAIQANSRIVPAWATAGFSTTITSYQPYSQSNYNGLVANLTRRFQGGLQMNLSYTWSKTMDDATAEVFATVLTPRRQQNSQCISCDYGRSALDRTNRITLEALWDLPYYKHSNSFLMRNVVGNWQVAPIYTYESPEYATVLSGVNSNLNGDSGSAISRAIINPNGVKGTGTGSVRQINTAFACDATATSGPTFITGKGVANGTSTVVTSCTGNTVGYTAGAISGTTFTPSNAYYVQAGLGTLPNSARNTLPIRPINNFDLSAFKRITVKEHYSFQFGAQAFNVLNHPQYIPGTVDNVNATSYTASYNYQTVTSSAFNHPEKEFLNNARTMQLSGKITF
ncbi:MAG: Cna domain protein [Edaphobacter sp.]|nr:Cna domain protein [Edaphobacter sp.]